MSARRERDLPWRTPALVAAIALSAGVIAALAWPRGDAPIATGPAPPGPSAFFDQPGRADALRARLGTTEEGRALLEALGPTDVRWCFGAIERPVVQDDRVLLLDRDMDEAELAARAGHLLHHVVHGAPLGAIDRHTDCERAVRQALEREAQAYALELRLRRALGVPTARYEFEAPFFAADPADGERLVLDYLLTHPEGGPGIDGLARAYRERCDRGRELD